MNKDENGYIVVETIGTFIPFILLIFLILSLVNIVTLQSRIHYALTQTANTLSVYSYALEVTGAANILMDIDDKSNTVVGEADGLKEDINSVLDAIVNLNTDGVITYGEAVANRVNDGAESIIDNPKEMIQLIMNYGMGEGLGLALETLVRPLVAKYLANGNMSGDEYLKSVNVINGLDGLSFYEGYNIIDINNIGKNDSVLIDKDGNVKLVVRYKIKYKFGALPSLPKELSVTQTVKTKAWLGGSGEGYIGDINE